MRSLAQSVTRGISTVWRYFSAKRKTKEYTFSKPKVLLDNKNNQKQYAGFRCIAFRNVPLDVSCKKSFTVVFKSNIVYLCCPFLMHKFVDFLINFEQF